MEYARPNGTRIESNADLQWPSCMSDETSRQKLGLAHYIA
jgi:hypothetical protein